MSADRMIHVPESALRAAAARHLDAIADLVACLPEPEPTFSDEEALAFYRAMWPESATGTADDGRHFLTRLIAAGWTAPKALCPPPLTKAQRHQEHYQCCNCLDDSAVCCDAECCPPPSPASRRRCSGYTARRWSPGAPQPEDPRCVNCGQDEGAHARHDEQEG